MSFFKDILLRRLAWMTLALFLSYLGVAMALPAVAVHVSQGLKLGNAASGLAVGIAFLTTIVSRGWAGMLADRHGGKFCMVRGLWIYLVAALLCLASVWHGLPVMLAYAVLLAGRLLLGFGESLVVVGLLAWGMATVGAARSGRVMVLSGMGMYGAFAVGGPLGLWLLTRCGFAWLMGFGAMLPLLGWVMLAAVPATTPDLAGKRPAFWRVLGQIWREGAVVGLQGIGFAALSAFFPLYFLARGWSGAGYGLTCFGLGFVSVRLLFGSLPDRVGGLRVAAVSLSVEVLGQGLLWQASNPTMALVGALLTGMGCSMVFPAMGVEVVRHIPMHLRGTAIGGFAAFQDLAYGATGPLAGLVADRLGYAEIFLFGAMAAGIGLSLVLYPSRRLTTEFVPPDVAE